MSASSIRIAEGSSPYRPAGRGYSIVYREGDVNFCPGCARSNWYIGRLLAECAWCGTAIPLAEGRMQGCGGHSRNRKLFVLSAFAA